MMDERQVAQEALFYEFSLDRHVPADHWVRAIDRFVDLSEIRAHLRPFCSEMGRPSVDPELMIRTGALKGHAFFAYATNYLIDLDHAVIVDVEASRAIRQAEVGSARTMLDRAQERFGLWPARLAADSAYGSAENLD